MSSIWKGNERDIGMSSNSFSRTATLTVFFCVSLECWFKSDSKQNKDTLNYFTNGIGHELNHCKSNSDYIRFHSKSNSRYISLWIFPLFASLQNSVSVFFCCCCHLPFCNRSFKILKWLNTWQKFPILLISFQCECESNISNWKWGMPLELFGNPKANPSPHKTSSYYVYCNEQRQFFSFLYYKSQTKKCLEVRSKRRNGTLHTEEMHGFATQYNKHGTSTHTRNWQFGSAHNTQ